MLAYNPHLAAKATTEETPKGGPGNIENPATVENIVWQTRAAAPSDYEAALSAAMRDAYAADAWELPALVARLNEGAVRPPSGEAWTESGLTAELARLAG